MSTSLKIAELWAGVGLRLDPQAIASVDRFLGKVGDKVAKSSSKFGASLSKAFNSLGSKVAPALAASMAGIGYAAVRGAQDALKFDEAITTLEISANRAMGTTDEMKKAFLGLSRSSGIAKEELVAAGQAYFDLTGDAAGTISAVTTFADVAKASATKMEDVSSAAAAMREQFGLMPSDFKDAFSILIAGGKAGAVSLANMASLTSSLGAKFKEFGGSQGLGGAASLSALFQTAMKDTGTAAEAATNLENLFAKIKTRRRELAKIGVKVEEGKVGSNKFKSVLEIVKLLDAAKKRNFGKFQDAFGADMQANAGLDSIAKRIRLVEELTEKTRYAKDVEQDLAIRNASESNKAAVAMNALKVSIVEAFTPDRIEKFVAAIQLAVSAATRVVDTIAALVDEVERLSGDNDQDLGSSAVASAARASYLRAHPNATSMDLARAGRAAVVRQGGGQINRGSATEDQGWLSVGGGWEGIKTRARFASGFLGGQFFGNTGDKFLLGDDTIAAANRQARTGNSAAPTSIVNNFHVDGSKDPTATAEEIGRRVFKQEWAQQMRRAAGFGG